MHVMSDTLSEKHNVKWNASQHHIRYGNSFLFISSLNCLIRCMGHIINLAQQSFICALTGGEDDPKDGDEPNLGSEDLVIRGAPMIRPLLARVRALVIWVRFIHCILHNSDTLICFV